MLTQTQKLSVLKLLTKIPKGRITTYGILAKKTGLHPRTVGMILNRNRWPKKYPCYKVVMSDGSIGGYGGGVKKKIELFKGDGIEIKKGKLIDFEGILYNF